MAKSMDSGGKGVISPHGKTPPGRDTSDYLYAIVAYDSLLRLFPETALREQTWFNLYYCYKKLGDEANAARML